MRPLHLVLPLLLAGGVYAQNFNRFGLFPGDEADAVTRPNSAVAGDMVNACRSQDFRYVGNAMSSSQPGVAVVRINGFFFHYQVQNAVVPQPYDAVIVPEAPSTPGTPDATPGSALLRVGLTSSTTLAGGVQSYFTFMTLATPFEDPNLVEKTWFYGIGLRAAPLDGVSIAQASYYGLGGTFPPMHDNPSRKAVALGWVIDRTNNVASQPSTPASFHVKLLTDAATLQAGQDVVSFAQTNGGNGYNPMFGVGGIWPDNRGLRVSPAYADRMGQGDGIAFRIRDELNPAAMTAVMTAPNWSRVPGFMVTGINGSIPIDFLGTLIALPGTTTTLSSVQPYYTVWTRATQTEATIRPAYLAQGMLTGIPTSTFYFMGVTADFTFGRIDLTNGAAVHFD